MTRIERLRNAMNWTQPRMAEYLGVRQATVSRLENGQAESGPISRLLDQLEAVVREAVGVVSSSLPSESAAEPNSGAGPTQNSEGPCPEAGSPASGPFIPEAVP